MQGKTLSLVTLAAAGAFALAGCASSPKAAEGLQAKATIEARSDSTVTGTATFSELSSGGVRVRVHIEKAPPGQHGLHIHEKGDCSDPKAASAGGHFNPTAMEHAGPMDEMHHAGDLGNIEIAADGKGDLTSRRSAHRPARRLLRRRPGRHLPREGRRPEDSADRRRRRPARVRSDQVEASRSKVQGPK